MKKQFARAALAAALLCTVAGVATLMPDRAFAEQQVSRDVGEPLNQAIKAIQAKDYKTAAAALQKAENASDKTPFDEYKINSIKAYMAVQQNDLATATTAYEAMAASPALADMTDKEKTAVLRNTVLLSGNSQHWPQVISAATQLEKLKGMDVKTYVVLADAYYLTNDSQNAAQAAQQAIDASKAAGQKPPKSALQIKMSSQAKSKDEAGAIKTLEQLAVLYGDPENWGQLIDLSLGTKGISDLDALYFYRLRFLSGATSAPSDYMDAARLALRIGYPTEAEADLEQGIRAGKISRSHAAHLLSQARSGARADRAGLRGFAAAAERSKRGEQDVKLAEDYWGYGRYAEAEQVARRGLAKGGVKNPGEGYFIIGISQVAQGEYVKAEASLAKVDGAPARAKAAHLWSLWAQHKALPAQASAQPPAPAQQQ